SRARRVHCEKFHKLDERAEGAGVEVEDRGLEERRDMYQGAGDGMNRAFEIALIPVIFGGLGYGIDRLFDIVPVFMIIGFLVGAFGVGAKAYYTYKARIDAIEANAVWAKR